MLSKRGKSVNRYCCALCVSLLATTVTQAQPPSPTPAPEMQAARKAVRKACANEMKSYCADQKGRQGVMCLRANSDKLGADCKDALSKLPRPNLPR